MDSVIIFECHLRLEKNILSLYIVRFDEILIHETQNSQVKISIKFWNVREFEKEERC